MNPDLLPDWAAGSQFRRYLVMPASMDLSTSVRLTRAVRETDLGPYLPYYAKGGVVLVPRRPDLEKFYLLPLEQVCFARTARDPEHDDALVRVLHAVRVTLRTMERERGMLPQSLGKIMCDDCGAHTNHRSRRMITNNWPVADGSACAPWKGAQFNQTYGEGDPDENEHQYPDADSAR